MAGSTTLEAADSQQLQARRLPRLDIDKCLFPHEMCKAVLSRRDSGHGLSKEVNDWLLLGGKPAAELAAKANPQAVTHVLRLGCISHPGYPLVA